MSHWGWHTIPASLAGVQPREFQEEAFSAYGHSSRYPTGANQPKPLYDYLRSNPHRLNLARVFLRRWPVEAPAIAAADVLAPNQTLDLWTGLLHSNFTLDGQAVSVSTTVHPDVDSVAIRVCSPLISRQQLAIGLTFPYGDTNFKGGSDWGAPASRHTTRIVTPPSVCESHPVLQRTLDTTTYYVHTRLAVEDGGCAQLVADATANSFSIVPPPPQWPADAAEADRAHERRAIASQCLEASLWFAPARQSAEVPSVAETVAASAAHWPRQWRRGAALDLSGSSAVGARELERRVVLSQYILMSQEAGSNPPQETALMLNSWYGKFHLEMRWHHQLHHFLWGRADLAQRSDGYFERVRSAALEHTAQQQGFGGVRWPKMVAPPELMTFEDGYTLYEGPSGAGPFVLWQQPHPLTFAEMAYRAQPNATTIARYNRTVHDTVEFMVSFILTAPVTAPVGGARPCRSLGPPMWTAEIESNEGRPVNETSDGSFELLYWQQGLRLAADWRTRQGLPLPPAWQQAADSLCAPLPRSYAAAGAEVYYPYTASTVFAPSYATQLFGAVLAPIALANATVFAATMRQAHAELGEKLPWCSNYHMYAMAAARLGLRELAASLIVEPGKDAAGAAAYLSNGHCRMGTFLPVYTPGNGALLAAVAMLFGAGWDADDGLPLPGVPRDGSWHVQAEGFAKAL